MDHQELLARQFEAHRSHLRAVAYRVLGSLSEADDAVQDAWLRLSRADTSEVDNLGGWLTTVVARVALNKLSSRTTRREQPLDVRVPDPIVDPIRSSTRPMAPTPSMKRCSPTRSGWRCLSCSRR
jgi:DNA-directed RNA polymerase specialized sigma24 family protein